MADSRAMNFDETSSDDDDNDDSYMTNFPLLAKHVNYTFKRSG